MSERHSYIELNRRFAELDKASLPEDLALQSYTEDIFFQSLSKSWKDLLTFSRVVVLGEPGSGKTWEFQHQAKILKIEGVTAFYVRLDDLITRPIKDLLEEEDRQKLKRWQSHPTNRATLFLDSVDESKLTKPSDFHSALQRLSIELGTQNTHRLNIFLSSRISEWQPEADAVQFLRIFPLPKSDGATTSNEPDHTIASSEPQQLLTVKLLPLNKAQVRTFSQEKGLAESSSFLDAIDRSHSWEFARRPADVVDLFDYWSMHHGLANLSALIEFSISKNLRASDRDSKDPLSDEQAQLGAEHLAAATMFCRSLSFRVPDSTFSTTGALDPAAALPADWNKQMQTALLQRPLFDSESYGRIRFHHRRTSEYLAAQWLARRIQEGCPITEILNILFDSFEGKQILRNSFEPLAAWLCGRDDPRFNDLRSAIAQVSPEIFLRYGDPSTLPVQYRRQILSQIIQKYSRRERSWITTSTDTISRFGDSELVSDINKYLLDSSVPRDLRADLIHMVRHHRMKECTESLFEIIETDTEPLMLRVLATSAIGDLNDRSSLQRLYDFAQEHDQLDNQFWSSLIEVLFPKLIGTHELANLIRKTDDVEEYTTGLNYYVKSHFQEVLQPELCSDLIRQLLPLTSIQPFIQGQEDTKISDHFWWICEVISPVLKTLLSKNQLTLEEVVAAASAFELLHRAEHVIHFHGNEAKELSEVTRNLPEVRRKYFWLRVEQYRTEYNRDPWGIDEIFGFGETISTHATDFDWLLHDIREALSDKDRSLALQCLVQFRTGRHSKLHDLFQIWTTISRDTELRSTLAGLLKSEFSITFRRAKWKSGIHKLGSRWWWERKLLEFQNRWLLFRDNLNLLVHIRKLRSAQAVVALSNLARQADKSNHSRWAPETWNDLEKSRGRLITAATRQGCKKAWRTYTPKLPHETKNTEHQVVVGLAGLQCAVQDSELDFSRISHNEARIATRYALRELNGFPAWFEKLACIQPAAVREVFEECIRAEWQLPEEHDLHGVLYKLHWHNGVLRPLASPVVFELLQLQDPVSRSLIHSVFSILFNQPNPPLDQIRSIAVQRVRDTSVDTVVYCIWLSIWLQLDAGPALDALKQSLNIAQDPDRLMLRLCLNLKGERYLKTQLIPNPDYTKAEHLRRLIPIVYNHIRRADDTERKGTFTPGDRDDVQDFRDSLLSMLANCREPGVIDNLRELSQEPSLSHIRDWILHLIEERLKQQADSPPWTPEDVRIFAREYEINPKTNHDLFTLAVKRLTEIKYDVEKADNSLRDELHFGDDEAHLRRWLQRKLYDRSRNRYNVPQEEEIDQEQRPDLRFEHPGINPISMEIKLLSKTWTVEQLLERLENQLVGQYLRAHNSRYGIYLLGVIGNKRRWKKPDSRKMLTFEQVVTTVKQRAKTIAASRNDVSDIAVISIDFRQPNEIAKDKRAGSEVTVS